MNKASVLFVALAFINTFGAIESQFDSEKAELHENVCSYKTTCASCIQTPKCAWCMQTCFQSDQEAPCAEEFVFNPNNAQSLIRNLPLSRGDRSGNSGSSAVQIKPQHVQLKLRVSKFFGFYINNEIVDLFTCFR